MRESTPTHSGGDSFSYGGQDAVGVGPSAIVTVTVTSPVLPAPWIAGDVGAPAKAGLTTYDGTTTRFTVAEGEFILCAIVIEVDNATKRAVKIERIQIRPQNDSITHS